VRSLCPTCAFVQNVHGRHGQTYYLCRNTTVAAKYPRQPVGSCHGFTSNIQHDDRSRTTTDA